MDLNHIADYLMNSLEHEPDHGAALESLMQLGLSAREAFMLLYRWQSVGPKERLSMPPEELEKLIKDAIKINY